MVASMFACIVTNSSIDASAAAEAQSSAYPTADSNCAQARTIDVGAPWNKVKGCCGRVASPAILTCYLGHDEGALPGPPSVDVQPH